MPNTKVIVTGVNKRVPACKTSRAQQRRFGLIQIPIAVDGLAIAVNPKLNISGLTTYLYNYHEVNY